MACMRASGTEPEAEALDSMLGMAYSMAVGRARVIVWVVGVPFLVEVTS